MKADSDEELASSKTRSEGKLEVILLHRQVISEANLQRAKVEANQRKISLRNALNALDICLEDEINWAISEELGIPFVLLSNEMVDNDLILLFPLKLLREVIAVPIWDAQGGITIVMADPLDESGFMRIQEVYKDELHIAVAPGGRVSSVLEFLDRSVNSSDRVISDFESKDSSGVVAVYGMIVAARRQGANRILIRPAGEGLEAIFRLERGWLAYQLWGSERMLSILTRSRIMMGVSPDSTSVRENARLYAKINNDRVLIEADFFRDASGYSIDVHIYPVISSPTLQEFKNLTDNHRNVLLNLLSARRPTGIVLINSPDQRQRYRMIYGLLAMLGKRNLDMISVEERKYLESQNVRRFQVNNKSPELDDIIHQESEVMAITDSAFWQWRELTVIAGKKLLILGLDFATSWLAISSFIEVIESQIIVSDRLRAIWSGKRVDLTCSTCGGRAHMPSGIDIEAICDACDGYGHSEGSDLFEVFVPDMDFRGKLSGDLSIAEFRQGFEERITAPSISFQLESGIKDGVIFNAVNYHE